MAVRYPTPADVHQAFVGAFPAGHPYDPDRWHRLARSVLNPAWVPAGEGIEVLATGGARLFRLTWEFAIDRMNTGSDESLRSSAGALQQRLAELADGASVSFDTPKSETQEGPVTLVRCWTRGIIG